MDSIKEGHAGFRSSRRRDVVPNDGGERVQHRIDFDSCAGMGEAAAAACVSFSLDAPTCASLTAHFRRACGAAEVHKGAVLSGRLDFSHP